jgi:hypothetical protein
MTNLLDSTDIPSKEDIKKGLDLFFTDLQELEDIYERNNKMEQIVRTLREKGVDCELFREKDKILSRNSNEI